MRWIKVLLVINRIDAIIVFAAVWTLVASYIYGGGDWYSRDVWSYLLFCSSWAIGAAAGCKQICWYRAAVLVVCQVFFGLLLRSYFEVQIDLGVRDTIPINPFKDLTTQLFQWLVVGLVSFGLHIGVRLSLEWCTKKMSGKEPEGTSRFEVLLYVTVLLWFTHWIVTNNSSVMTELGRKSLPNLLRISLVSYVLAHCLTGRWSWIFACVFFPALGLAFFFRSSYELYFFWLVVGAVLLIAALIAIGSGVSRRQPTGSDLTPAMTSRFPSIWGVLPAVILLLFNISPNWVNLPTLFSALNSDLPTRWYYAKANGAVLRSLDGVGCWDETQLKIVVDFADARRNDRLELTSNRIAAGELSVVPRTSIRLHNMHPEVAIPTWSGFVSVHKGSLTTKQLENLASTGSYLGLEDVSLITDKPISKNVLGGVYFLKTSPSKLRGFLDALGADCKLSGLVFDFPITEDYWPIVLEAGKQHSIWQLDMAPNDFLAMVTSSPETTLKLHHGHQFTIRELAEFPKLFEKSLPGLMVSLDDVSPLSPLEAVMLVRNFRLAPGDVDWWSETPDWDTEDVLTFERFETGKPKSVFLPALPTADFKVQGLESVETLSIDSNWIKSNDSLNYLSHLTSGDFDASLFEDTTRLQRLYLPWYCPSFDQIRLAGLRNLKELQIPWHVFEVEQNLEKFPKLEKLTLFAVNNGVPVVSRRLNLPNLKKLDVVIWDERVMALQQMDLESVKAMLEAALPGVEISIISLKEFRPEIPVIFQSHLEIVTVQLLKKLEAGIITKE